ncbi:hypothetical protein LOK49_LG05G03691 [Camellia lanceoleosa]|uniref:Uncharacterized protein n=1 Tax=Camellia lanceoleosa TaxID=1840588 RepID=A0ACC0HU00_9ERIC|nr:hypothetical protein LOK49_LG05G03691 [Camellia lanceoleosa]
MQRVEAISAHRRSPSISAGTMDIDSIHPTLSGVLSPLVARRRGRPCTKWKVSKVDEIVNRLKGKNKKATKVQGRQIGQCEPRKLNFGCTDGMEDNMYDRVPEAQSYYFACMDGTQESALQMVDKVGSSSLSESGMANIDDSADRCSVPDLQIDVLHADASLRFVIEVPLADLKLSDLEVLSVYEKWNGLLQNMAQMVSVMGVLNWGNTSN